ncbi:MAG: class I SAM-dependent methyltransferase [Candidatus Latescibacterota bacterium]
MSTIKSIVKQCLPYGIVEAMHRDDRKEVHINRAFRHLKGHTYVEIGVQAGVCFDQIVAPRKIAIDPVPMVFDLDLGSGESFYSMTSDEFFDAHADQLFGRQRVDVALVDGLHEFGQTLRDILNLERYMSPAGVIFIHDCNPPTRAHTQAGRKFWTGDVWKMAPYLTTYRLDLTFFTLDCDWGVGVLTGFRSSSCSDLPSPEILAQCQSLDYEWLDQNRKQILRLRPPWYSRIFFGFSHRRIRAETDRNRKSCECGQHG